MKRIKLLIIAIAISGLLYAAATPPNTLLKLEDYTYTSVSEGKFERGTYKLASKMIILTSETKKGELKLSIKALANSTLLVVVDAPTDLEAKYLTIHFKG